MLGLFFDWIVDSLQIVTEKISLLRDSQLQLHRVSKNGFRKFEN